MSPIALFTEWLLSVPSNVAGEAAVKDFKIGIGQWTAFEQSYSEQYVAFTVVGGASPRELNTRFPHIMVTIVGAIRDEPTAISTLAESIMQQATKVPEQCAIIAVNPLGDVIGPASTNGGRPLLTLTMQMII